MVCLYTSTSFPIDTVFVLSLSVVFSTPITRSPASVVPVTSVRHPTSSGEFRGEDAYVASGELYIRKDWYSPPSIMYDCRRERAFSLVGLCSGDVCRGIVCGSVDVS